MPAVDPSHWLHRLTAVEWLEAATTELEHAATTLGRRAFRPGVTHARRAAGMAWNAVLAAAPAADADALIARYGRSYMEHVAALASDDVPADVPDDVRAAAALLRDTPPAPPALVQLGKPDVRPLEAARAIVAHARAVAVGDAG
jgi:hypothetical protein